MTRTLGTLEIDARGLRPADWFPLRLHDDVDHYGALARRRADTPVQRVDLWGTGDDVVVVYRYDDAAAVLADADRFSLDVVEERYGAVLGRSMLTLQPAARRAVRHLLLHRLRADNPSLRAAVREVVADVVDGLVAARQSDGTVDLVPTLGAAVPARVLARVLGLAEQDWPAIAGLAAAAASFIGDPRGALRAARSLRRRFTAAAEVAGHLPLLGPDGDAQPELDDDAAVATLLLLAWAGTETTFPAIVGTLFALLTHDAQRTWVGDDRGRARAAADELLRWDAPVQVTSRRAVYPTEIGGVPVVAGTLVLVHLGAANRDDRRFAAPNVFDPTRTDTSPHLAFGHGSHRCVGWQLARLELSETVAALFARYPRLRMDPDTPPPQGQVLRSPRQLRVWLQ